MAATCTSLCMEAVICAAVGTMFVVSSAADCVFTAANGTVTGHCVVVSLQPHPSPQRA